MSVFPSFLPAYRHRLGTGELRGPGLSAARTRCTGAVLPNAVGSVGALVPVAADQGCLGENAAEVGLDP